ncbi:GPO family capsid scaffolding protein [Sphingomonas sp. R647]|uniref:GPO family capsid scaffolding protein n=1 Tax=Sphingomonas sp. R647 TaxID=2875233 RepID=UPI001CD5EC5B|nr:GPO family capsid scaffolding protein [Sphingomonas sp. R647]MCA1199123.1 GPO family capsid scaffolding protein [Sphingomonas sp. R647]
MAKTKFFRVAVEGDTVDGRKIEANWIKDIVATFDPKTYGARVNMEHIRGITDKAPFKSYGDVVAVRTAEVDLNIGGKPVKKLALEAQIDPTDDLVAMNRDKQKLYTSIEVQPNFANSNKAYLVGLAVTDSPASLGTEVLSFALDKGQGMSLAPRVQQDGNVFSLGLETSFELDETAPAVPSDAQGLFAAATAFFKHFTEGKPAEEPKKEEPKDPANDNEMAARFAAFGQGVEKLTAGMAALQTDFTKQLGEVKADVTKLRSDIETTDGDRHRRPPASGTGTYAQADF